MFPGCTRCVVMVSWPLLPSRTRDVRQWSSHPYDRDLMQPTCADLKQQYMLHYVHIEGADACGVQCIPKCRRNLRATAQASSAKKGQLVTVQYTCPHVHNQRYIRPHSFDTLTLSWRGKKTDPQHHRRNLTSLCCRRLAYKSIAKPPIQYFPA